MSEFFKPLRRKIGVVTLFLALLLMVGWVRSQYWIDDIKVPLHGGVAYGITSMGGGLDFHQITAIGVPQWSSARFSTIVLKRVDSDGKPKEITPWFNHQLDWRWDWAGFHFGAGRIPNRQDVDYMVPYWSIVVPLTLIACWLLLSKPRKSTRKRITESVLTNEPSNGTISDRTAQNGIV